MRPSKGYLLDALHRWVVKVGQKQKEGERPMISTRAKILMGSLFLASTFAIHPLVLGEEIMKFQG